MSKFNVGDFVIIKSTIGDTNEVCEVIFVRVVATGTVDYVMYKLSNGSYFEGDLLKLWNPKTDLEGRYKMKQEISMNKKYVTRTGNKVELLAIRDELFRPVVGIVNADSLFCWHSDGCITRLDEDDNDLIEANPYADFKIDDKVIVWDDRAGIKYRGYFAGINEQELPMIWDNGTSWQCKSNYTMYTTPYDNCVKWDGTND